MEEGSEILILDTKKQKVQKLNSARKRHDIETVLG